MKLNEFSTHMGNQAYLSSFNSYDNIIISKNEDDDNIISFFEVNISNGKEVFLKDVKLGKGFHLTNTQVIRDKLFVSSFNYKRLAMF